MVTKQVHKRQLLLSENEVVRQVVLYTMAYCAKHYNIALHSIIVEGNHYHRADTDADAKRPLFNQTCHALIAKQLNVYYKERDALFSNQQTSVVESANGNDTLKRIAYSMGNPVKDGIDREGKSYKGIRLHWPMPDMVIKRPSFYWRTKEQGGKAPDELTLRFIRPPGFENLSDEELGKIINERILAFEKEHREKREAEGKTFRCDHTGEPPDPRSFPKSPHKIFQLSPWIGAAIEKKRIAMIPRLKAFRAAYRDAMKHLRAGDKDVVFPYGTSKAVRVWGMDVELVPT